MGEIQGIINLYMERFGPGRFSDVDYFTVISLYGGGDPSVSDKLFPDRGPAVCDSVLSQFEADGVQYMVSEDSNEQMTIRPVFLLMINGSQSQP